MPIKFSSGAFAFAKRDAGMPEILDAAVKFAYDALDLVGVMSNSHLKDTELQRPNIHPSCQILMTKELRELFQEQWDISMDLKLVYLILNAPRVHNRDCFTPVIQDILAVYKRNKFSKRYFVELVFILCFWSLILWQRNEWRGGPDFVLDLITRLTRDILNKGGLDACQEWPDMITVQGTDVDFNQPLHMDSF